jgi:hypothetical protein
MKVPGLPEDLVAVPRAVRRPEYDPTSDEPASLLSCWQALKIELFPMDCQGISVEEDDPHYREMGCYLALAVNLVVSRHKVAVLRLVS